jgi:hypothetical protein
MAKKKPKRRRSEKATTMVVGVAWYAAAEWDRLKEICVDAQKLEDTHAEWLRDAERAVREFEQNGLFVRRVPVAVDALIAWCQSHNCPIDASARAKFAAEMVQRVEHS